MAESSRAARRSRCPDPRWRFVSLLASRVPAPLHRLDPAVRQAAVPRCRCVDVEDGRLPGRRDVDPVVLQAAAGRRRVDRGVRKGRGVGDVRVVLDVIAPAVAIAVAMLLLTVAWSLTMSGAVKAVS